MWTLFFRENKYSNNFLRSILTPFWYWKDHFQDFTIFKTDRKFLFFKMNGFIGHRRRSKSMSSPLTRRKSPLASTNSSGTTTTSNYSRPPSSHYPINRCRLSDIAKCPQYSSIQPLALSESIHPLRSRTGENCELGIECGCSRDVLLGYSFRKRCCR